VDQVNLEDLEDPGDKKIETIEAKTQYKDKFESDQF